MSLLDLLNAQGFRASVLERVGALILGCSLLENQLEVVLWQLGKWPEPGEMPATDKMMASQRISTFKSLACEAAFPELRPRVDEFADAAENILAYRNAIAHGYPIGSFAPGEAGISISNTRWHGEKRKRDSQTAHLDERVIDMVLEALFLLLKALHAGHWQAQEEMKLPAMLQSPGLSKARLLSDEARSLSATVNGERV
ncbi:hypothetical protein OIU35_29120 [Boseaceae bacterium BT-24-1]|jgi:hypothetical protein|nr:hypothetical protein [Boseaceae bacterium BT-24-1]